MLYLDSSALAKHYFKERGSRQLSALLQKQSVNAPVHFGANLRRDSRDHCSLLSRENSSPRRILFKFARASKRTGFTAFRTLRSTPGLLGFLQDILAKHPLRGADAVHLASALWLRDATRLDNSKGNRSTQSLTFACSDIQLNRAAAASGLTVFNPET